MATVQASTFGLRNVKMLQGLSQERLEILAAQCAWRTVEPGKVIVARNSHDRDVHFVVSGHVRVTSFSAGGRQVTFRDEEPGEMFGDLAAIDGQPRSADVLALDGVLVASLSPEHFRTLIAEEELAIPDMTGKIFTYTSPVMRTLRTMRVYIVLYKNTIIEVSIGSAAADGPAWIQTNGDALIKSFHIK